MKTPTLVTLALCIGASAPTAAALAAAPTPDARAPAAEREVRDAVRARFGERAEVRWDAARQTPRALRNLRVGTAAPAGGTQAGSIRAPHKLDDAPTRALAFLEAHGDLLTLTARSGFDVVDHARRGTRTTVRLAHTLDGLPVEGQTVTVTMDGAGSVVGVRSGAYGVAPPEVTSDVGADGAKAAVEARFGARTGQPSKVVLAFTPEDAYVAWRVPVVAIPLMAHFHVWVEAETGRILRQAPAGHDQPMTTLPMRGEGGTR